MSSVTMVVEGLCLWLTGGSAGVRAIIPDFAMAVPAHVATISVPPENGQCPAAFRLTDGVCEFPLNGMGNDGGVQITLESESTVSSALHATLCQIPHIQHDVPLTLRSVYAPPNGSKIAAQMLVTTGRLVGLATAECPNCPRSTQYTLSADPAVSLRLSNLRFREPVVVPLRGGAQVTISNKRAVAPVENDTADWCLYFTMFEEVGCPGTPPVPVCPPTATRPALPHVHPYRFETIACSNSQYP